MLSLLLLLQLLGVSSRNFDTLKPINTLTTLRNDASANIAITVIQEGDDNIRGQFDLSFDDGLSKFTTEPLDSFISASDLQTELEKLPNIGTVSVVRSETSDGYDWDIEFVGCALKQSTDVCNDGNLLLMETSNLSLTGCGGPSLAVSKLVPGTNAGKCENLEGSLCSEVRSVSGNFPISHVIRDLEVGEEYFVRAQFRTEYGYSNQQLSHPESIVPSHNAPSAPPPPFLVRSSATSITIGWEIPHVNGGASVSGYELWMDDLSGADNVMVYDGIGEPNIFEYQISTKDSGPLSQVVESGRQYRFQVRAINQCLANESGNSNSDAPCYGAFSESQIFTVRDPRSPLPPSAPLRDYRTNLQAATTSVTVSWKRPLDNGGSPITGYVLYMKDSSDSMMSFSLSSTETSLSVDNLNEGEVYRFHVVALNNKGRSGNSPSLTVIAATYPGLGSGQPIDYIQDYLQPEIVDVDETSMTVSWKHVGNGLDGGSPVTGYKLYAYEGLVGASSNSVANQEVQHVQFNSDDENIGGTFTLSYGGYETGHIPVKSTSEDVQHFLGNIDSINIAKVTSIPNGWAVTFLSEAGDLPLMGVTTGRLIGPPGLDLKVSEHVKGDDARLVYDGSDLPSGRLFTVPNLLSGARYAFKVSALNAVGDGIIGYSSQSAIARSGASASRTTASGGALSQGMAGRIQEVQIVSFVSNDCNVDKLIISFQDASKTENLCDSTADELEIALEALPSMGGVHVTRTEVITAGGSTGYSWSVTFISLQGDVPLLSVDVTQVGGGKDMLDKSGSSASYVTEFLKGCENEFIIEPKKRSGAVVRGIGREDIGEEIFFTELWSSENLVVDGSHEWYSDGGVATYNPVVFEEQTLEIPKSTGSFKLSMDTSPNSSNGRLGGFVAVTSLLDGSNIDKDVLQNALGKLDNIGRVEVTSVDNGASIEFVVTFVSIYGEMPLLQSSDLQVKIHRRRENIGVTEIQSVTSSSDKTFIHEIQTVAVLNSDGTFRLSFMGDQTGILSCNFASSGDAIGSVDNLEKELNRLDGVFVEVNPSIEGSGVVGDPWIYKVTFVEPVGNLELLSSDNAEIHEVSQGFSPLSGTFVLAFNGEYTKDIPFDSPAVKLKYNLELLPSIEEVDVKKVHVNSGFKWEISFTKDVGNLPSISAYNNRFEIQKISSTGGVPTPLGGTFSLSYGEDTTTMLPFDISMDGLKAELESLPSIGRVDVTRNAKDNGQFDWFITFRIPETPALLIVNDASMSGSLTSFAANIVVSALQPSMLSNGAEAPNIVVEEKVPGLPSYSGSYSAQNTGLYSLAVMRLQNGGLSSWYYDNQWLSEPPSLERIDGVINFNWGHDSITQFGRDFVSVRWWGKVLPTTSEIYTFYINSDDGARLYVDHQLVIDNWDGLTGEKRANVKLLKENFHDIKIEYKEETGPAHFVLQWSSSSVKKATIPKEQLYFASHIFGSPFRTSIIPGAADYPHSDLLSAPGFELNKTLAGEPTHFYIQAKDSEGNKKGVHDNVELPEEQFTVEIIGQTGTFSGEVSYVEGGKYRVDYTLMKAGQYKFHVRTGGTDIYCGKGEKMRCSPFDVNVEPGPTIASTSEAESKNTGPDSMVEARAGENGSIFIQAKDVFGNNIRKGGDKFNARFRKMNDDSVQYRGYLRDHNDGTYEVSYSIPVAGLYLLEILLNDDPVRHCVGAHAPFVLNRNYNGMTVYNSPSFCDAFSSSLNVIHNSLHAGSSTIGGGQNSLQRATIGIPSTFTIEARDKFGNIREGSETLSIDASGDGASDAFVATLSGPGGYNVVTSSAIQVIKSGDSSIQGYFRVSVGKKVSDDLPHDITAPVMQTVLLSMFSPPMNVEIERTTVEGNYHWALTFSSRLDEWISNPLTVVEATDGDTGVSSLISVEKSAKGGYYPIQYTLWKTGTYDLTLRTIDNSIISGTSYTIEAVNNVVQATSCTAHGQGLISATAGEPSSFQIQTRDSRRPEVQSIRTSFITGDFVNEIQRIEIESANGAFFDLTFRGERSSQILVGSSSIFDLKNALENLASIDSVMLTTSGSQTIFSGDSIDVEFTSNPGPLSLLSSSGTDKISKVTNGVAPFRLERQVISCDGQGGSVNIRYNGRTSLLAFSATVQEVQESLETLFRTELSLVDVSGAGLLCSNLGSKIFVDVVGTVGDLPAVEIIDTSFTNGSIFFYGEGEEVHGAVDGIKPLAGSFTLSFNGVTTIAIDADASQEELKAALEDLPNIGSISVTKSEIGLCVDSSGANLLPKKTCGTNIWEITFGGSNTGCKPGNWQACPSNNGDMGLLIADDKTIVVQSGGREPKILVSEISKGTSGNIRVGNEDLSAIDVSFYHSSLGGVGIGMENVFEIECSNSAPSSTFVLRVMDQSAQFSASSTVQDLIDFINDQIVGGNVLLMQNTLPTICDGTTIFKIKEGKDKISMAVASKTDVNILISKPRRQIDAVNNIGDGLYEIIYTPVKSGHYNISIQINDEFLWTDVSAGLNVEPSQPDAISSHHAARLAVTAGEEEEFMVTVVDRFGNRLTSPLEDGFDLIVDLEGTPHRCNMNPDNDKVFAHINEASENDGRYLVLYTPSLAGIYDLSIFLRSQGGLLTTFFRSPDFSDPVLGINDRDIYEESPWCKSRSVSEVQRVTTSFMGDNGDELIGSFQLQMGKYTTDPIPYDATANTMKARLEVLPNIDVVEVTRSGPSPNKEYVWDITFY